MFNVYSWAGEPIENIEQWAFDKGEMMVDVTWKKKDVFSGKISYYKEKSTMPESFWNTLRIRTDVDGTPIKVIKRKPTPTQEEDNK